MRKKKVLISGAGIAGTVVAHWLPKDRFAVKILEKAPAMRDSGQAIEVSSPAVQEVTRMMGIQDAIKSHNTSERGLKFVDDAGAVLLKMEMDRVHGRSFTSEEEILRSDLARILYDLTKDQAEYVFDSFITEIAQDGDAVDVVLNNGERESHDYLIVCDGLYSKTRSLAHFREGDVEVLPFNVACAYFTVEDRVIDMADRYAKWYTTVGGRQMLLRPDSTGQNTRAYFSFRLGGNKLDRHLTVKEQKSLVRRRFEGTGYVVNRVLDGMDEMASDFYMSEISQMRCRTWHKGRVVLCGDAAYCPSPFSGAGVDCAILGAYILAQELSTTTQNHEEAFGTYERKMRPFIDDAQSVSPRSVSFSFPESSWGLTVLRTVLWIVSKVRLIPLIQSLPSFDFFTSESFKLPQY